MRKQTRRDDASCGSSSFLGNLMIPRSCVLPGRNRTFTSILKRAEVIARTEGSGHAVDVQRLHAHLPNEHVAVAWIFDANVFFGVPRKSLCCVHPRQRPAARPAIPNHKRRGYKPGDPTN